MTSSILSQLQFGHTFLSLLRLLLLRLLFSNVITSEMFACIRWFYMAKPHEAEITTPITKCIAMNHRVKRLMKGKNRLMENSGFGYVLPICFYKQHLQLFKKAPTIIQMTLLLRSNPESKYSI